MTHMHNAPEDLLAAGASCVPGQGYVHSLERGASVDGPGLRLVAFLTGCPLRCQYCHNPDTQKLKNGQLKHLESILDELRIHQPFLQPNSGGLTLSGGEPLVQLEFSRQLLQGAKALGLHTALDTSGYLGTAADDAFLELVDLVLLDLKSGLPQTYSHVTGVELQPTLDFAQRLQALQKPVWVRFVLVPGLTDAPENVEALGRIIASLSNIQRVEILPFHKMGETKWRQLGRAYTLYDTPEATPEQVQTCKSQLIAAGVRPQIIN